MNFLYGGILMKTLNLILFVLFLSANLAYSANYTVDDLSDGTGVAGDCEADAVPSGDDCSLRDALEAVTDGDTIDFSVTGVITITEDEYLIMNSIEINGPGSDMLTIDGDNTYRIFLVDDESSEVDKTVLIKDLKLQNGNPDDNGGAIANWENLTVESCVFENNVGDPDGGAIFNTYAQDSLTVIDCTFTNNRADDGGAIYNNEATIESISGSSFVNNTADRGGAIYNDGVREESMVFAGIIEEIKNSTFTGNTAGGDDDDDDDGGAIYNYDGLIETIQNTTFNANSAYYYGGGIYNYNGVIQEILMSSFTGNNAMEGGAVYSLSGFEGDDDDDFSEIMLIDNTDFNSNTARYSGGAIYNRYAYINTIDNSEFNNNMAGDDDDDDDFMDDDDDDGGAIYNRNAIIHEILNSKFEGNSANPNYGLILPDDDDDMGGGAIFNYGESCCHPEEFDISIIGSIIESIFSSNFGLEGGAVFNGVGGGGDDDDDDAEIHTILRSTFNDNSAEHGSAIFNEDSIFVINNNTFNGNKWVCSDECFAFCSDGPDFSECVDEICGCEGVIFARAGITGRTSNSDETDPGDHDVPPGAYEGFFDSWANISFSTFSENPVGISLYGDGIGDSDDAGVNLLNTILAENSFRNCICDGNDGCGDDDDDDINDFGGNYEDFDDCNFPEGFNNANILIGPLADNGGPTQTVELIAGDPLDGAGFNGDDDDDGCIGFLGDDDDDFALDVIQTDQRGATRPNGSRCDSGAYETGVLHSVTITKLTFPPGGMDFVFDTTGFDELIGCDFNETENSFTLDDGESKDCVVPGGNYEIDEIIPDGQVVNIICSDTTDDTVANNQTGELTFSFSNAGTPESVNCLFINSFPDNLLNVTDEPAGVNCENGGVKIDVGTDDNQNNMLDEEEIDDTFYVCNGIDGNPGAPGAGGGTGSSGTDGNNSLVNLVNEPAGSNCTNGGVRVETGVDDNDNGVLDPSEVEAVGYVCNGTAGTGVGDSSGSSGTTVNEDTCVEFSVVGKTDKQVKTRVATVFLMYLLIPGFVLFRRYRRRMKNEK